MRSAAISSFRSVPGIPGRKRNEPRCGIEAEHSGSKSRQRRSPRFPARDICFSIPVSFISFPDLVGSTLIKTERRGTTAASPLLLIFVQPKICPGSPQSMHTPSASPYFHSPLLPHKSRSPIARELRSSEAAFKCAILRSAGGFNLQRRH